ncbi:hypothetical protein [Flavobacterium notoginsengisoli]|uniref:hypothetical protein n=1 Tax=Flavobacterium notoginsengisoli TaxID=1478199 RepID=UPI003631531D
MKIFCLILILVFAFSCKKYVIPDDLTFVPQKSMNINGISLVKNNAVCIGSYTSQKDTVVSQYNIQSKYSLIAVKLGNTAPFSNFKNYENGDYSIPGYFSIVNQGLYEVKVSPKIFDGKEKITSIDFYSDKKIIYQINNDSIKSFDLNFNKFTLKINNDGNKVLYSNIEYYGLKSLDAQILLYKSENQSYLFIMTPAKENILLEKDFLYHYFFN